MLFNLVLPFIEVIIHTYIDLLREEEEEAEQRQINQHGQIVNANSKQEKENNHNKQLLKVSPMDLISVNEKLQQKAIKTYYEKKEF